MIYMIEGEREREEGRKGKEGGMGEEGGKGTTHAHKQRDNIHT